VTENTNRTPPERIWSELEKATIDRGHGWRTPVMASVDTQGLPQARTLVLRELDKDQWRLSAYTDHRSPKVAQLRHRPLASLVFWSSDLKWQLRVLARVSIQTQGERVAALWQRLKQTSAAGDYLSANPPGTPLVEPHTASTQNHALGILDFYVQEMDWLELNAQGHKRARLNKDRIEWLAP